MPTDCISYQESGYFSKLMVDYLNQKPELGQFYNHFPSIENFEKQIREKQQNFAGDAKRETLVEALEKQYEGFAISGATRKNIADLTNQDTFTITTGHQLNLFTGPLYFLYKIVSVINLTKELRAAYPDYNFVPVYWMATEDHDFEEINHFSFKRKKIHWNTESTGPVGRLPTDGLDKVLDAFALELGPGKNAGTLKELFRESYLNHATLADATRFLANALFGEEGLVIVDGDDRKLKKLFIPFAKEELLHRTSFEKVSQTIKDLKQYDIQVNPREINLFYIEDHIRERIVFENGKYKVNTTTLEFSEQEILDELENSPEKFSPNVILRPLYQEIILPNLCYIGGGGEIAYWLELKEMFDFHQITFPMLLLRNSVLLVSGKQEAKADKLQLRWQDLFAKQTDLVHAKTIELSAFNLDFSEQKAFLHQQFEKLGQIASQTHQSFTGAVKAQEAKQLKGLENLEKKLLKAEKKKYQEELSRITSLQEELFPNQGLQERQLNFSEFYLESGNMLIATLLEQLQPLTQDFSIVKL
ncbi:bacillithiol biosynthesis cysteine-adding enzyme BshC [Flavobacterium humi]|uniref:Putative cysteine ligase BshC n=1 Tax=Flavobacterium humi TaxID=2562683 RepID=A0A4Z0L8Y5_9FLAO|nr:bacillithiol biosynthesis cysteine-adding enzyme BshC [Flavobacterium humi]TGD58065.1 bacillithiol biosynthesis cysteine-adding enzyme BshC [Flavobacterium humi]